MLDDNLNLAAVSMASILREKLMRFFPYVTLTSISYTSKLRNSDVLKGGVPEIRKRMVKMRREKMRERVKRSAKTRGSAS